MKVLFLVCWKEAVVFSLIVPVKRWSRERSCMKRAKLGGAREEDGGLSMGGQEKVLAVQHKHS